MKERARRVFGLPTAKEMETIGDTIREKIISKCSGSISEAEREMLWLYLFTKCVPVDDVEFSQEPVVVTNDLHERISMPIKSRKTITIETGDGKKMNEPLYTMLIFLEGKPDRCVKFKQIADELSVFQLLSNIDRKLVESVESVKFVALFGAFADYCIFLSSNHERTKKTETPATQPPLKELPVSESKVPVKRKYTKKKVDKIDCIQIKTSDDESELASSCEKIPARSSTRIANSNDNKKSCLLFEHQGLYQQISITTQDYKCLHAETYLNDVIINFCIDSFLKNSVPKERLDRIHVFSSFFYFRLTTSLDNDVSRRKKLNTNADKEKYNNVKNWTKKVNVFEKDYLLIPINIQSHWLLAVVCFPGLDGCQNIETNEPYDLAEDSELIDDFKEIYVKERKETKVSVAEYEHLFSKRKALVKQPCILFFDSMPRLVKKIKISATIRSYLTHEYETKYNTQKTFSVESMPGCAVYGPRQSNSYDCGLFLLTYVEKFFAKPFEDYRIPIVGMKKWFDKEEVARKRKDIAYLIIDEIKKRDKKLLDLLPKIMVPTTNGPLGVTNSSLLSVTSSER